VSDASIDRQPDRIEVNVRIVDQALNGTHEETQRLMSDYVEGDLRGYRRWRVARHLARCEPCRALYRALLSALGNLRALRGAEPPAKPEIADSVVERIRDDERDEPG
jgi:predicted anti-sigma-YlaC factor YlaD